MTPKRLSTVALTLAFSFFGMASSIYAGTNCPDQILDVVTDALAEQNLPSHLDFECDLGDVENNDQVMTDLLQALPKIIVEVAPLLDELYGNQDLPRVVFQKYAFEGYNHPFTVKEDEVRVSILRSFIRFDPEVSVANLERLVSVYDLRDRLYRAHRDYVIHARPDANGKSPFATGLNRSIQ